MKQSEKYRECAEILRRHAKEFERMAENEEKKEQPITLGTNCPNCGTWIGTLVL